MNYIKSKYTPESIIQAELYNQCREVGLSCDLEYQVTRSNERDWCILDFVMIENNTIIAIVEVKRFYRWNRIDKGVEKQVKKYKQFGIPVFILYSLYDIPFLVKKLVSIQKTYLKSIKKTVQGKCNEADKVAQKIINIRVEDALHCFNKLFPNYEFTNKYTLETIVEAVKVLGYQIVMNRINRCGTVEDFFVYLDCLFQSKKHKQLHFLDRKLETFTNIRRYGVIE